MPKISPIKINLWRGDLKFQHEYPTDVLSDGTFQSLIPADHVEIIRSMLQPKQGNDYLLHVAMVRNRAGKDVLQSKTLAKIQALLQDYGYSRLDTEQHEELLIFYRRSASVAYVLDADGNIHPNGMGVPDYRWRGKDTRHEESLRYSAGVSARIVNKITHRHANGFYIKHDYHVKMPAGSAGEMLNRFVRVPAPGDDFWSKSTEGQRAYPADDKEEAWQYMPYSEEAAAFFVDVMTSVCRLSERMRLFFGDDPSAFLENLNTMKALPKF